MAIRFDYSTIYYFYNKPIFYLVHVVYVSRESAFFFYTDLSQKIPIYENLLQCLQ